MEKGCERVIWALDPCSLGPSYFVARFFYQNWGGGCRSRLGGKLAKGHWARVLWPMRNQKGGRD